MKIWIVWLPNVWKSTLFNALTNNYGADAQNFPFCTIEPNVGIVNVNDPRLEQIRAAVNGAKVIPANCEFIDIAGIVKGASAGEWLGNKFLANIREVNAILQVVRVFENDDIIHVHGKVDPKSDKKEAEKVETYKKVLAGLMDSKLASSMEQIRDMHLLTNKEFVYACNVSEDMMSTSEADLQKLLWVTNKVTPVCAKLEADMIEMSAEEKNEFLQEMELTTTGLDDVIKASYDALGLQYYFTAGEQEVRAWTVKKWATAPQAAWVIHTEYIVQDWDVMLFKFNN